MHGTFILRAMLCLAGSLVLSACSATDDSLVAADESDSNVVTGSASSAMTSATIVATGSGRAAGSASFNASLSLKASATGCDNRGSEITIDGDLVISGFGAKLTASNNVKLTHSDTEEVSALVTLYNGQDPLKFQKGGKYGVTGNPEMYLEVYDNADHIIGSRIFLGRCNRPLAATKIDFKTMGDIDFGVATGQCSGAGGPQVVITGAVTLREIKAKLILQNRNGNKSDDAFVEVAISLVPPGKFVTFNKGNSLGDGVGGNPLLFATLLNASGVPVSDDILLGRCNSL